MTLIAISAAALLVALVASEIALGGAKLQTVLSRLLLVWAVIGAAAIAGLGVSGGGSLVAFGVFWAGCFLTWFGVRSHIESSILLRMVYLLREGPLTEEELMQRYNPIYGGRLRVDELVRGGLAERVPQGLRVTPRGKRIASVAARLK